MNKLSIFLLPTIIMLAVNTSFAQEQHLTDRFDHLLIKAAQENTSYEKDLKQFNTDIATRISEMNKRKINSAAKTTSGRGTIPVIFHIVLDSAQMKRLGSIQDIEQRITGQLEVLNTDFNAKNADASNIPGAFQPLYTSLNVNFALAHTGPNGKYTKGYEIVYTTKNGFDENNLTIGSKFACSDVKFAVSGGTDAWDTKKYYNVWVTNILPAGIGGIGTPPPYSIYGGTQLLPFDEQGTVISYLAFGKKEGNLYFPIPAAQVGRTLVHETGHFLNLFHPFGISTFNNNDCKDDDGVSDTPPQAGPSVGKPAFPLTDGCSPAAPGVMWMNHMDYSDDEKRLMFTKEQADRMAVEFEPGGYRYELLQHPELLNTPLNVSDMEMNTPMHVWPNPVKDFLNISFKDRYTGQVVLLNTMGQIMVKTSFTGNKVQIDMSNYPAGTYIAQYITNNGILSERINKL